MNWRFNGNSGSRCGLPGFFLNVFISWNIGKCDKTEFWDDMEGRICYICIDGICVRYTMEKLNFSERTDAALILQFIRDLAEYEKMLDEVIETEDLLIEWIFEKNAEG